MLSNSNLNTVAHWPEQPGTRFASYDLNIRPRISMDEFSLPPYFFDKEFLDHGNILEPYVKERTQLE